MHSRAADTNSRKAPTTRGDVACSDDGAPVEPVVAVPIGLREAPAVVGDVPGGLGEGMSIEPDERMPVDLDVGGHKQPVEPEPADVGDDLPVEPVVPAPMGVDERVPAESVEHRPPDVCGLVVELVLPESVDMVADSVHGAVVAAAFSISTIGWVGHEAALNDVDVVTIACRREAAG